MTLIGPQEDVSQRKCLEMARGSRWTYYLGSLTKCPKINPLSGWMTVRDFEL